jgi:hypothetical protein
MMFNKKTSLMTVTLLIEKQRGVKKSLACERYLLGTTSAEQGMMFWNEPGNDQDDPVDTGSSFIEILYSA